MEHLPRHRHSPWYQRLPGDVRYVSLEVHWEMSELCPFLQCVAFELKEIQSQSHLLFYPEQVNTNVAPISFEHIRDATAAANEEEKLNFIHFYVNLTLS